MLPNAMQLNSTSSAQSLENRIAQLESVLKLTNNTLTLQVGATQIVISPDKIELICRGAIRIRGTTVNLDSQADIDIRAGANLSERASSTLLVQAGGTLNLKGAMINEN